METTVVEKKEFTPYRGIAFKDGKWVLALISTPEEEAAVEKLKLEEEERRAPEREAEELLEKQEEDRLQKQGDDRLEEERLREIKQEKEKAELDRYYKEEIRRHRAVYRFTPEELDEIKWALGVTHQEEMVQFLVGYRYNKSEAGYYYLWDLPVKIGQSGIFDTDKPHWAVPSQDLIWFWMECRRDGRSEDQWNFHSACIEIRLWLKQVKAGMFKVVEPCVLKSQQERRQKELRRSLADLFQQRRLESITLQRQYQDGRLKSRRVSLLTLRRALQLADPGTWGNVQAKEFWIFIVTWMEEDNGRWIKFDSQFRNRGSGKERCEIVMTLNGYDTPMEEEFRKVEEYHAEEDARRAERIKKWEEEKRRRAEAQAVADAEEKRKEQEQIAILNAMTPEEKEERNKQRWLHMIEESPFTFASFLKNDPSLSRYIPSDCTFPVETLARHS